ncbi:MAG: hypothetical protein JNM60_05685 [Candidatus Competibacteraceae bacterium]|nr:hypothetical protein [Candidatus Competibacteraceae bacterium]
MPTRTFIRLTLLAGLAAPLCAFALGVGPLAVRSALNQNFEADIPLIANNPGELNGITVQIPRQQDFDRAGIERLAMLSKLRLSVETPPGGPNVIRIRSIEPIREPNFNLLLEVIWSRGRLIREFTVQVDPELYANRQPPPPPLPPPVLPKPVAAAPEQPAAPRAGLALPPPPPVSFEGATSYGPVRPGETLSGIASRVRPSGNVDLRQMMSILLAGNPGAFANGNPNELRRGATLKVPTAQALGVQGGASPPAVAATSAPAPTFEPGPISPPTATASPESTPPAPISPVAPPAPITPPPAVTSPSSTAAPPPVAVTPPAVGPEAAGVSPSGAQPPALSPAEQPREIVPQASIPQAETPPASAGVAPPASTAPPVAVTAPPVAAPPVAAPPPAVKPPTPVQPVEESSWMDNPMLWLALALIGLAIASVLLLPLLRRAERQAPVAQPFEPSSRRSVEPASSASVAREPITQTRVQTPREPELTRPIVVGGVEPIKPVELTKTGAAAAAVPAVAAMVAAASPPSIATHQPPNPVQPPSVTELLRDIDFGIEQTGPTFTDASPSALNVDARLPDAEPVTASATRRPTGRVTEQFAEPNANRAQTPQTELPSELRLDGFDFEFNDLTTQQTGSHSAELPPLELKLDGPGKATLQSVIDGREPATEPASSTSFSSILSAQALADKQTIPTMPTAPKPDAPDNRFDFSDVTQEFGKQQEPISLRLDEKSLPDFGNQPFELPKTEAPSRRERSDTTDYMETKLDLATAYLDMGDQSGARGLLEEVLAEGDVSQKQRATDLLKKIG